MLNKLTHENEITFWGRTISASHCFWYVWIINDILVQCNVFLWHICCKHQFKSMLLTNRFLHYHLSLKFLKPDQQIFSSNQSKMHLYQNQMQEIGFHLFIFSMLNSIMIYKTSLYIYIPYTTCLFIYFYL